MLYVRYDKSTNVVREEYSAYVSFRWFQEYVDGIKSLPVRYWIPAKKEWEIPLNLVPSLKRITSEITELNQLEGSSTIQEVDLSDFDFKTKPYEHQLDGVEYGILHPSWLLGDQQGLGKTKQMIDLAVWKKKNLGIKHCLIVCCVNNLKYNWLNEVKIHSNETACVLGVKKKGREPSMADRIDHLKYGPNEFFWITNIESLRTKKEGRFYKSELVDIINSYISKGEIGMIIVDEIHKCKNSTSAQGRGLLKLKGASRVGLSGTLLVNKPLDLYTPLAFIGAINQSQYQFDHYYSTTDWFGNVVGYQHLDELQRLMDANMLRRTKDILDLPPKMEKIEYIELSKEERKLYDALEQGIREEIKADANLIKSPASILAKITRLRQTATHCGLISDKIIKSSKFDRLGDILEEARGNGEKVIVFTMFRQLAEMAIKEFKEYNPLHIWGQMNQTELEEQKRIFQEGEDFNVMFGQIGAAGTGHTLTRASIVVFLDLPWDRATMEQAEDRAHRIGTKKTVTCIRLLAKDTYDERLWKRVLSKGKMSDALIDMEDIEKVKPFIDCIFESGEYEDEGLW